MTDQEILALAPEGATNFDEVYLKKRRTAAESDCWLKYQGTTWVDYQAIYRLNNIRSLADIRRIVELEKYNGELVSEQVVSGILAGERIAELEQKLAAIASISRLKIKKVRKKHPRNYVPCRVCGVTHKNPRSSSLCGGAICVELQRTKVEDTTEQEI